MISTEIRKAIDCCILKNIPFAVYVLPNSNDVKFYANPSASEECKAFFDGRDEFIINFFNNDYPYEVGIQPELTATEIINKFEKISVKETPEISPWPRNTEKLQYYSQAHQIIQELKRSGGKTVLSRVITGEMTRKISNVISEYFGENNTSFRYAYMSRETGCWIGATPEILYIQKKDSKYFETMSLAGTRLSSQHDQPWDIKNIDEHNYVTDYIVNTLVELGIDVNVGDEETIQYGIIEHLCHKIKGENNNVNVAKLLKQLSPTPAVAGYPLEYALEDILHFEVHPRYCYTGFVGVADTNGLHIFVNLRCVHLNSERYCIYGGGGLTELSIEADEWEEVELKTSLLKRILSREDKALN